MTFKLRTLAALAATFAAAHAMADITIGVSLPLTGPTSALGIPCKNGIELWPKTLGGEKLNVIILDDATDPTVGVKNARRFITEDHVDVILGSAATPIAVATWRPRARPCSWRSHQSTCPKARAAGRSGCRSRPT
jgi:ABC-type sugar transport system substrate-binding protein